MSDPVLDLESTSQDASARELYEITHGNVVYRLTSGTRDIVYGGNLFVATAIARTALPLETVGEGEKDLEIILPVDHAFVRRYLRSLTPPQGIALTLRRYYSASVSEQIWTGSITAMAVDDSLEDPTATFRCSSYLGEQLQRPLPARTIGTLCPFTVYDRRCLVDRTDSRFFVNATVLFINGRTVRYDQGNTSADGWAKFGELVVTSGEATGERVTIATMKYVGLPSTVVEIELHSLVPGLNLGEAITVYAGCDLTLATCRNRFDNVVRFGGQPHLPTKNPFLPAGFGPPED